MFRFKDVVVGAIAILIFEAGAVVDALWQDAMTASAAKRVRMSRALSGFFRVRWLARRFDATFFKDANAFASVFN